MNILINLLTLVNVAFSARILGVFQMPAYSHQCVFQTIWRELSLRGHQVTVVTPNPLRDPNLINLTEIDVGATNYEIMDRHGFRYFMSKNYTVHSKVQKIFALNYELAEAVFAKEEFIKIYNDSESEFDLVIAQTYVAPTLYSLAARFNAPLVGVASMGGWIGSHFAMGNSNPPSLYSEMFLTYNGLMSFWERFKSTLYYWWAKYFLAFEVLPKCDKIARKYLGNDIPYIGDIERNMSLLFLTTNHILYTPRPTVPNIISLEQMHIKPAKPLPSAQIMSIFLDTQFKKNNNIPYIGDIERNMSLLFLTTNHILYTPRPTVPNIISLEQMHIKPAKPLPSDLKAFLDEATEGVIVFSLGSNVRSIDMPMRLKNVLIEAFTELPYKILWKFEADNLPGQPENVVIKKWIPQADVLAHPNVKVLFTQCGLQSIEEAVSRAVPIVGMPFIADQSMNIKRLAEEEVAIGLDYVTVTKDEIKHAITKVIEDKKYRINMKKLSALWVDQPMKSLDRAMWWIEYVIRHKGAKHLRSPTLDISWFDYLLIDVLLVIGLVTALFILAVIFIIKFITHIFISKFKLKQS